MKKKLILSLLLTLLSSTNAKAMDGIVIVLDAPLLKEPSLHSQVMQRIRKGQRVFIPSEVLKENTLPEFIPTFDRAGNRAYVPSRFIKIVTKDMREYEQPITLAERDPTDYRIEEPIPETYPFGNYDYVRASASIFIGNNTQASYAFEPSYDNQDLGNDVGARIVVARKVTFDAFDRMYFGIIGSLSSTQNSAEFKNQSQTSEDQTLFRVGPILTYDLYKSSDMRFTFGGGFTYNSHKSLVGVESQGLSEERVFTGYSLSPLLTSTFQFKSMVPHTDFIAGADISAFLPYTLKAETDAELPDLWNEIDDIKSDFKLQASLFFGLQYNY
jgi:hypothetical protein